MADSGNSEKDETKKEKVGGVFKNFASNTSAHCFAKIEAADNKFLLVFWLIVLAGATTYMVWGLHGVITEYLSWPTDTSISVESGKDINFPAVTLCNLNPLKYSALDSNPTMKLLADGTLTGTTSRRRRSTGSGTTTEELNEDFLIEQTLLEEFNELNETEKVRLSYQKTEFLLDCLYKGTVCSIDDFYQWSNPVYGNCFTFNSGWNGTEADKAYRTGRKYGLRITLNVGSNEYLTGIDNAAGLRIVVHDQDRMPFPDEDGYLGHPGTMVSMTMKKERVVRMPQPYGDCIQSDSEEAKRDITTGMYPVKYSQMGCNHACYQQNVIDTCGCFDANYFTTSSGISSCRVNNPTQEACRYGVSQDYANGALNCDENCPHPCEETNFDIKVTSASWPSEKRLSKVIEKLQDKIPDLIALANATGTEDTSVYYKNLMMIEVFYETFNYQEIVESAAYDIVICLANVGGVLGLALGFSMITFLEVFELIIIFFATIFGFFCGCFGKKPTRTEPMNQPQPNMPEGYGYNKPNSPPPRYDAFT